MLSRRADTTRTTGRSSRRGFRATLIVGTLLVCVGLVVAAPSLLRARVAANEAAVVADTRSVISAEEVYASANCGFFGELTRLCREGEECEGIGIPGYVGPDFIDSDLGRRSPYVKSGYERSWTPNRDRNVARMSPRMRLCVPAEGSERDYCYASRPLSVGWSGVRSFSTTSASARTDWIYAGPTDETPLCPPPMLWCVVEGVLVATPLGPVPIENLTVGDEVWGVSASGELARNIVVGSLHNTVDTHLRLDFTNGESLELTTTHPVSTPAGWKSAGALRSGDSVRARDGTTTIASIQVVRERAVVYDISVEPDANFFANGTLVHNKSF